MIPSVGDNNVADVSSATMLHNFLAKDKGHSVKSTGKNGYESDGTSMSRLYYIGGAIYDASGNIYTGPDIGTLPVRVIMLGPLNPKMPKGINPRKMFDYKFWKDKGICKPYPREGDGGMKFMHLYSVEHNRTLRARLLSRLIFA